MKMPLMNETTWTRLPLPGTFDPVPVTCGKAGLVNLQVFEDSGPLSGPGEVEQPHSPSHMYHYRVLVQVSQPFLGSYSPMQMGKGGTRDPH